MISRNRLANCHNRFQRPDKFRRVLCVCSAGMLRSPTIAWVLSNEPFNYNTRAAGISDEYALVPVDQVLIEWADEIVFAAQEHLDQFKADFDPDGQDLEYHNVKVLNIPDEYDYRDDVLVQLIRDRYFTA